ncbi:hypothetical protein VB773_08055 [Haloarculaceae archaeon H-GB2-1]|nr:hypothetical protein [Haloarculaceae archaeon H-GB2-1]
MQLLVEILLVVVLPFAGVLLHELLHYSFGWAFGGGPYFNKWTLIVPYQVDYETPKEMSNIQTKITGGAILLFPFTLAIVLALTAPGNIVDRLPLIAFLMGGSIVSDLDLLAVLQPEKWKKWTNGEPISRSD